MDQQPSRGTELDSSFGPTPQSEPFGIHHAIYPLWAQAVSEHL